jgi:hypothetical protein
MEEKGRRMKSFGQLLATAKQRGILEVRKNISISARGAMSEK